MRRSENKILTTHVGSLPHLDGMPEKTAGDDLRRAVKDVVALQRDIGLDIVNEGEYTKGGDWLGYLEHRFSGFEEVPPAEGPPLIAQGRDREAFAAFYAYASQRGVLFYEPGHQIAQRRPTYACTGPIAFAGQEALRQEIELFGAVASGEAFLTSTAPASIEVYRRNLYYKTEEEYLFALADAMAVEYRAIVDAGFLLQVDDAWLPALWDRIGVAMGLEAFRKRCMVRVEALNHALAGIPEDRIRYHLCWGSWHGPHAFDLELVHLVDILLQVKAQAYLIEAANARHEHEHDVWSKGALPNRKILIPGVVTHSTDIIEHPELVSQRILRFAAHVGKENVIAGTDCGFGGRSHPQIAWAKLRSLVEGAERASKALRYA
ncbi:MAG TPA: cobalamin-independent methionine synthase II family protein [Beijerinckiaceae bacterium]|nr:cobalamin-independent methionine synthase II family protein [Beijerinckiaceae bacterium]HVB89534.1 cobalamin-independent methionine synthase II family protein [Beijerinckiaceae bacterium]